MSYRRCLNVVDQRWSNVENETKSDVGFSMLCSVDTTSVPDVETTSNIVAQRWYNIDTTLFQASVDVSSSSIESNRASDDYEFVNRWIVFILLNEKTFFTTY